MCYKIPQLCGHVHPELDMPFDDVVENNFYGSLNSVGAREFLEATPDFYGSEDNAQMLIDWIDDHGAIGSARNFRIAYDCLKPVLQKRPAQQPAPRKRAESRDVQITVIPNAPTDEMKEWSRAIADPLVPDTERKRLMAELKRQAIAERYQKDL